MPCLCSSKALDVVLDDRGPRRRRNSIAFTEQEDDHSHPYIHEVKFLPKSNIGNQGDDEADDDSQISSLSFESASNPPVIGLVDLGTPKRNAPQAQNSSHSTKEKEKKKLFTSIKLFDFLSFRGSIGQKTDISSPLQNESIGRSHEVTKLNQVKDSEEYSA